MVETTPVTKGEKIKEEWGDAVHEDLVNLSDRVHGDLLGLIRDLWEDLINSNVIYFHIPVLPETNYGYEEGSATIYDNSGWRLQTGSTSGSVCRKVLASRYGNLKNAKYTWEKERILKTSVKFWNISGQEVEVGTGAARPAQSRDHVGFYIKDDTIYMSCSDGDVFNKESTGITITADETVGFKIKLTPGVKAEYWVNGTKQGELTSNLPSGTSSAGSALSIEIKNTEAADKRVGIGRLWFLQLE